MSEKVSLIFDARGNGGGGVMEWNYKELAATLRAQMGSSHPPVVVINDGEDNTDREEIL